MRILNRIIRDIKYKKLRAKMLKINSEMSKVSYTALTDSGADLKQLEDKYTDLLEQYNIVVEQMRSL